VTELVQVAQAYAVPEQVPGVTVEVQLGQYMVPQDEPQDAQVL
jgi:hypothetical protein